MIDFEAFEAFQGEKPYRLLDRHPDNIYLAMQTQTSDVFSAAIWNSETKQLVWSPEDAHGLAWLHHGTQIASLQNPILSEDFLFTIYTWPQGQLIQQCPLLFPMGYLFDLVISPKSDFALCQWTDQCEFGFEFVNVNDHGMTHIVKNGYINRRTNFSTRPVFSPDGRLWVFSFQENIDWWIDKNDSESNNKPAKGGKQEIGSLMVFQETQKLGKISLIVTVPTGYLPRYLETPDTFVKENIYISDPIFIDTQNIALHLPSGESRIYNISEF
jgi:hypothetical protein